MQSSIKKGSSTNAVPGRENKPHIGIFGRCNAGKSSLLNLITGADTAIVSSERGTTTDIVRKSYEILDFAPVIFLDTAGVDDSSPLGEQRIARTLEAVSQIDLAILIFQEWGTPEEELAMRFRAAAVPFITVCNINSDEEHEKHEQAEIEVDVKHGTAEQLARLLEIIKQRLPRNSYRIPSMFEGRVSAGETVLLVCPIDSEAPAGRLILPQVQAIRELLDRHAIPIVVQPSEITRIFTLPAEENRGLNQPATTASRDGKRLFPRLVVTDSQVFREVRAAVPQEVEVTSFSILLAAAKGDYELYKKGLEKVEELRNGDRILIAESCSHQVSCDDIGRVKIPRWLEAYTGHQFEYTVVSGLAPLPKDLSSYTLMIQCGGCMVTRSQLQNRIRQAARAGVAVTNYGMLIRKLRMEP